MEGTVGVPAADWAKMEAGCHSYHPLSSLFKYTDGVPRCDSQPKLIHDLTDAGPQRERPQTFHIHRHHDGIARLDTLRPSAKPRTRRACQHRAIGAHDVDALFVRLLGGPAALVDVIVAREAALVEVRGWVKHLADHRYLLHGRRDHQFVLVLEHHVRLRMAGGHRRQIDDQSPRGLHIFELLG